MAVDRGDDGGAVLARVAMRVEGALSQLPPWSICVGATLLGALKAGWRTVDQVSGAGVWDPATMPQPVDYYPFLSYGFRIVGWILGASSLNDFLWMSLIAAILCLGLIAWLIITNLSTGASRLVAALVLSGPITWILFGGIGRVDALVVAGAALLGIKGREPKWAVLGAVVALMGAPEQAFIASGSLLLLALTPAFRSWRKGAILSLFVTSGAWIALQAWALSLGQGTRATVFGGLVRRSVQAFLVHLPLEVWAGFGLGLVFVAWAIAASSGWNRLLIVGAVLGPPAFLTLVTTDQSRVWVLTSAATLLAVAVRYGEQIGSGARRWLAAPLTVTLFLVVVLPAVEIQYLQVRSPWESVWPYLTFYVFGSGG